MVDVAAKASKGGHESGDCAMGSSTGRYLIRTGVHVCITDGSAILLDLRRDKYFGLGPVETSALSGLVEGWPLLAGAGEAACRAAEPAGSALELAADMQRSGLLTTDVAAGKPVVLVNVPNPRGDVPREGYDFSARDVFDFMVACSVAAWSRRFASLHQLAVRQGRRGAMLPAARLDPPRHDPATLAASFIAMRPLLFGAKNECLFDSIAMLEFLWRRHIHATWVLGVKVGPFAAHSWVQYRDVVMNDTKEYVSTFTPIFAI